VYFISVNGGAIRIYKVMLKVDLVICFLGSLILYITYPQYILPMSSGIFVANISFGINTYTTNIAMKSKNINSEPAVMISYYSRIILITIVAVLFYFLNIKYLFVFCIGYSLHLVSIVIYPYLVKKL
jgi:ATP synthase protein I